MNFFLTVVKSNGYELPYRQKTKVKFSMQARPGNFLRSKNTGEV